MDVAQPAELGPWNGAGATKNRHTSANNTSNAADLGTLPQSSSDSPVNPALNDGVAKSESGIGEASGTDAGEGAGASVFAQTVAEAAQLPLVGRKNNPTESLKHMLPPPNFANRPGVGDARSLGGAAALKQKRTLKLNANAKLGFDQVLPPIASAEFGATRGERHEDGGYNHESDALYDMQPKNSMFAGRVIVKAKEFIIGGAKTGSMRQPQSEQKHGYSGNVSLKHADNSKIPWRKKNGKYIEVPHVMDGFLMVTNEYHPLKRKTFHGHIFFVLKKHTLCPILSHELAQQGSSGRSRRRLCSRRVESRVALCHPRRHDHVQKSPYATRR
jgi:hypothetical protein